jgi:DNA polymerase phi
LSVWQAEVIPRAQNFYNFMKSLVEIILWYGHPNTIMPGTKRTIAQVGASEEDGVHPARKPRIEDGKAEVQLSKIYNDLADEEATVRLQAAGELLNSLSTSTSDQISRVNAAITRLIKGVCSDRKAARLGFPVALSEVLRLAFDLSAQQQHNDFNLDSITAKIIKLTEAEGKKRGQEKRNYLLGRRFAFQAVLQSDVALHKAVNDAQWKVLLDVIVSQAQEAEWLRAQYGAILHECVVRTKGSKLSPGRISTLIQSLRDGNMLKTAEGVALWLAIQSRWTHLLPKDVWTKKDPLAKEELPALRKALFGSTDQPGDDDTGQKALAPGARRTRPSFAWLAVLEAWYAKQDAHKFSRFWREIIEHSLISKSSSIEKKAFCLQILAVAVAGAPTEYLDAVLSETICSTLLVHRAENSRYLFEASRRVLVIMVDRIKVFPDSVLVMFIALVRHGCFDQHTKTKTLESMIQRSEVSQLQDIVTALGNEIAHPPASVLTTSDSRRRHCADLVLSAVREHKDKIQMSLIGSGAKMSSHTLPPWLQQILDILVRFGYHEQESDTVAPTSEQTSGLYRLRLMSVLTALLSLPSSNVALFFAYVLDSLHAHRSHLRTPLNKEAKAVVKTSEQARKSAMKEAKTLTNQRAATATAFVLLFGLSTLQVYNSEPDSIEALEDLQRSYSAWKDGVNSSDSLVELLLSFVCKPSALLRKLAEQVFSSFAAEITAEGLHSLVEILGQKESLSGQQALFEQHDEDVEVATQDGDGMIDVDDMSDVELVNGGEAGSDGESSSDDESSDAATGAEEDGEEDEETAFDRKLADALGTAGMHSDDSDDDGSDMDDDQMMALEPHLTTIFKERKKIANKKQDNKDARENIVNFKNRVLDLITIYFKSQHANVLAMDLILPLTSLIRTTASKPTAEKAFAALKQYFELCSKHKVLPHPQDAVACFDVLSAVHDEVRLGGSKLHASACSRSSLFLAKVLVSIDRRNYERIAKMYAELQNAWYTDAGSKVHGSVFTEWTSWSLTTRKTK